MNRLLLPLLSLALFANALESVAHARIPVIYGYGDTISEMGALPPAAKEMIPADVSKDATVGFMYGHFHIYYLDFWTWNGRHVVYDGNRYWEPDEAEWNQLLGSAVGEKFSTPVLYHLPPGLTLVFATVVGLFVYSLLFPNKAKQVERLSNDASYTSALQMIFPDNEPALSTSVDAKRLDSAVASLTAQGIAEAKARRNLQLLAAATCATRDMQINAALAEADHLPSIGENAESIKILEHLIASLSASDWRREEATRLLVERKATAAPDESTG